MHRTWALKFIAALTSRLGKDGIMPYLDMIMQPLYRIQESGSASDSDEVCIPLSATHTHDHMSCMCEQLQQTLLYCVPLYSCIVRCSRFQEFFA